MHAKYIATVQLNLNLTQHVFHFARVHARLVMSNLPCKALVYTLDVCTMHACMSGIHMPNLDYACMQIVSQGQQNKLHKHVYVLRCNPLVIQDVNPAKEYLTVKLKRLEDVERLIKGCCSNVRTVIPSSQSHSHIQDCI